MPTVDGVVRGVPTPSTTQEGGLGQKPEGLGKSYGTATYINKATAWQSASCNLPSGVSQDNDIVFYMFGCNNTNYWKRPSGYDRQATCITSMITTQISGEMNSMDLIRKLPGVDWPTSFQHSFGNPGSYPANITAGFRLGEGMEGRPSDVKRFAWSSTSSITMTIDTNPGPYPGGFVIAVANIDTGGAGPNAGVTGTGWTWIGSAGTNSAAYYILDTATIETPPNVGWSCSRSATWTGLYAFIR